VAVLALAGIAPSVSAQPPANVGPLASARAAHGKPSSRVILTAVDADSVADVANGVGQGGGVVRKTLPIIDGLVADMPTAALAGLAQNPHVGQISVDRVVVGSMERTGATIGATAVRQELGLDGSGIGVAVIDSGVTSWHDDLTGGGSLQRVDRFVDFVNQQTAPYDDYGHGTHVSGIIAGNGADSGGARSGVAPNARLIELKVLDANGVGHISDVIAALQYVVTNRTALNIRVVNLSVATGVYESYRTDPLTKAARKVVSAGVVVVAAAGNYGVDPNGRPMYAGITSPGNAPWVLTVGASSHMGTVDRSDDTIAAFSSRGPAAVDYSAKPDLVAPGVGIESLSNPNSAFYTTQAAYLLDGTVPTGYLPYLSQSGTSMSAPVVSGTVALMLQANPSLTPNAVKAILQYTAQVYPQYDPLTQGAGFLNAKGAVELAQYLANAPGAAYPASDGWSGTIIWGNSAQSGGRIVSTANAWRTDVLWGATSAPGGAGVTWGVNCATPACDSNGTPWALGSSTTQNVVWGSMCGGSDCSVDWSLGLFGTTDGDTVVWGTSDGDTVVWGTDDGDTVVWGTNDGDTVVWGTTCAGFCVPVIWNR
jgi:serine protease AprX